MKKLCKWLLCVLVIIICSVLASVIVSTVMGTGQPTLFGWGMAVVESDSMEPNIHVGSLIIIHKQEVYENGDIVTYINAGGKSITHRIVELEDGVVLTKGDANSAPDEVFLKENIVGKVRCVIPNVGKVISFFRNPIVITVMIIVVCILVVWDITSLSGSKKKPKLTQAEEYVRQKTKE